jgi:hypothetical protein
MKKIAIYWSSEDVLQLAEWKHGIELTENQADEILENIKHTHDANVGINWDVIDCHISMYLEEI